MIMLKIGWMSSAGPQAVYVTDEMPIVIGRHPDCDVVLDDPHVSRHHAAIFYRNGHFYLHNMSRTNPVVFHDRWELAPHKNIPLQPGDLFQLGQVVFQAAASTTFPFAEDPSPALAYLCAACGNALDRPGDSCHWCGAPLNAPDAIDIERSSG